MKLTKEHHAKRFTHPGWPGEIYTFLAFFRDSVWMINENLIFSTFENKDWIPFEDPKKPSERIEELRQQIHNEHPYVLNCEICKQSMASAVIRYLDEEFEKKLK